MARLDLISLRKDFGAVTAVNDIDLSIADGEFMCILGPSGCGKSTALRMIGGFEEPTGGDVHIDGASIARLPPNRRPTAMVFQKYTLWPHMRVFDNVAFGLRLRKKPRREIDREVRAALDLVGLGSYGARYPSQLSGGEQQRVALARALVLEPKILLLDEPFSNLDALLRVRLREELRAIQRRIQITTLFVTHDQEEALSLADRIAVMSKGSIVQVDKPARLYALPQTLFVADFIGAMNLFKAASSGGALYFGGHRLPAPQRINDGEATVAIRPEDFAVIPGDAPEASTNAWGGRVTQLSDLGHYCKAFADVTGLGVVKLYLPKSAGLAEGDAVMLTPTRYLVYQNGTLPIEVRQPA